MPGDFQEVAPCDHSAVMPKFSGCHPGFPGAIAIRSADFMSQSEAPELLGLEAALLQHPIFVVMRTAQAPAYGKSVLPVCPSSELCLLHCVVL